MIVRIFALSLAVLAALPALAERHDISGQTDPAFQDAVTMWLNGSDVPALRALSDLSNEGNTAAQILLARVERHPNTYSHVTKDMTRKARIALLRQPKGLSGKSWMAEAAKTDALAAAFLASARKGQRLGAIGTLLAYGEAQIAHDSVFSSLTAENYSEVIEVLEATELFDPAQAYLLLETLMVFAAQDRDKNPDDLLWIIKKMTKVDGVAVARFQGGRNVTKRVDDRNELLPEAIANYERVPRWEPMRQLCAKAGASDQARCTVAGAAFMSFLGGNRAYSPVAALIAHEQYWQSERFAYDLSRLIVSEGYDFRPFIAQFDLELASYLNGLWEEAK